MLYLPVLSISLLLLGILGMIYIPEKILGFSIIFMFGVAGTLNTILYSIALIIGACYRPPILPLR